MPSWGRPSWGRNGGSDNRRRREWERQQREWESSRRFEELDSDSDIDDGVNLHYRKEEDSDDEPASGDEYYARDDMQIAMREKEDVLLARALARIRRAQELGRENVKLTPAESEALERKMAKDRAKGRKPIIDTERIPSKKSSRQSLPAPAGKRRASRSSFGSGEQHKSRSVSRETSSQNLQQLQPPRRRPLPDDPNWRPRSSSSIKPLPYPSSPQDNLHRLDYPSSNTAYRPNSRHVSGPAEIDYPHLPPYPTGPGNMPSHRSFAHSSSDPALGISSRRTFSGSSSAGRRRELFLDMDSVGGEDDEEEDDDDEEEEEPDDQGVQVIDVRPNPGNPAGYVIISGRAQGQGSALPSRASQTANLGRRKGGGGGGKR